ncbi:MAG: putative lipid II flippase FtsW [Clostridia bacterium]|nr:putative lipid II flippase FtsW [Clostridia bacterium]
MRVKRQAPDFVLFVSVLMLLSIGIVMILSASEYSTLVHYSDSFYFFKRQLLWALLGLTCMFLVMNYDYWNLRRYAPHMLITAFVLLILVLLPGIGREVKGATRWIGIGSFGFQPSELVKLFIITFMAYGISRHRDITRDGKAILPYLLIIGAASGLILMQPDLGTAFSLAGTLFIMLFAAGYSMGILGLLAGGGMALVAVAIAFEPYRLSRFLAFLNPWEDPSGAGFHIIQSLYALGSGGLFGAGLGQGKQKYLYLPEQHTDFIFAVVGEELGFVGGVLILTLFTIFVWRGLRIALTAPDPFASLLATGITVGVGLQAFINIGVVTGSLPVTGITLPFISFGGTSLVFTLIGVGILLNISKYAQNR